MMPEMRSVFGVDGRRALDETMRSRSLLAFDFDGTLAPIVFRPDDARVAADVAARLERLARLRPVAVVTGRAANDVLHRLGFVPLFIVGNHGAEEPGRPFLVDTAPLRALRARLDAQSAALQASGIELEDKGYSLALHYRRAADVHQARLQLDALLQDLPLTLCCMPGKFVFNIVIAGAPDKFDAVASLVARAGCAAAVFVGDDANDEAVFVRAPPHWLTVRVGHEDPASHARYFLETHADVAIFLDDMLAALERP